jgi:hypothetical protein
VDILHKFFSFVFLETHLICLRLQDSQTINKNHPIFTNMIHPIAATGLWTSSGGRIPSKNNFFSNTLEKARKKASE